MGFLYDRKKKNEFYASRTAILLTLRDLAYAAAHGGIAHDKLIRLGRDASNLIAQHGHLARTAKSDGSIPTCLWPPPKDGFPKFKKREEDAGRDSTAWCACGDELDAVEGQPGVFWCMGCDDYYELKKRE